MNYPRKKKRKKELTDEQTRKIVKEHYDTLLPKMKLKKEDK